MPFIVDPTIADKLNFDEEGWKKILATDLRDYRKQFEDRHKKLPPSSRLEEDLFLFPLRTDFFYGLVTNPLHENHYLVAHYVCDSKYNGFKNLKIVLCIKSKDSEDLNTIISPIYATNGDIIDFPKFEEGRNNYIERRRVIQGEFKKDREGRAHKITSIMRKAVRAIYENNKEELPGGGVKIRDMYVFYIIDSEIESTKTMSVVFCDRFIDFKVLPLADPDAYDHGTACCPIG